MAKWVLIPELVFLHPYTPLGVQATLHVSDEDASEVVCECKEEESDNEENE